MFAAQPIVLIEKTFSFSLGTAVKQTSYADTHGSSKLTTLNGNTGEIKIRYAHIS
jgi:hypothetical protein